MILLIDNQDSFTFNLFQAVEALGRVCVVLSAEAVSLSAVRQLVPSGVILSPGPGRPEAALGSLLLAQALWREVPLLGVCLGHQVLGQVFGCPSVAAKRLVYGKAEAMLHQGQRILAGLPQPFFAARYHSLALSGLPENFDALARTEDGELMAMAHRELPVYGLQFHPESFMTPQGANILGNFLAQCPAP
ncbi:MAG: aminodeoxychorismate/anthranilate synthase component II [bacterium]|nr:aminodeoxychorismate/anthranilate synthase component II [bacterium]